MNNPNDATVLVKTPYGDAQLPLDFDVRYKSIPVNIKEYDGSSIASATLFNGKLVDFRDGPFKPTGAPYITLRVGEAPGEVEFDLSKLIKIQTLNGFGYPAQPLDFGVTVNG